MQFSRSGSSSSLLQSQQTHISREVSVSQAVPPSTGASVVDRVPASYLAAVLLGGVLAAPPSWMAYTCLGVLLWALIWLLEHRVASLRSSSAQSRGLFEAVAQRSSETSKHLDDFNEVLSKEAKRIASRVVDIRQKVAESRIQDLLDKFDPKPEEAPDEATSLKELIHLSNALLDSVIDDTKQLCDLSNHPMTPLLEQLVGLVQDYVQTRVTLNDYSEIILRQPVKRMQEMRKSRPSFSEFMPQGTEVEKLKYGGRTLRTAVLQLLKWVENLLLEGSADAAVRAASSSQLQEIRMQSMKAHQLIETEIENIAIKLAVQPRSIRTNDKDKKFRDKFQLPEGEFVIEYYSCCNARHLHGYLYVASSYLCFETVLFAARNKIVMHIPDIINVRKSRIAKFLDNSLTVEMMNGEVYFFTSFLKRNDAFRDICVQAQKFGKYFQSEADD
eukprot:gnl/Hemi2/22089_TR7360_c0_g1_i1.p1 gnl/Hemi2/22089_TR7360_c0_g1~~gnl/Hemi2/22089_TR7360_c0_g1_i1.p1  ORF type:complete len:460 (+),score=116.31 gnl/Hemi2/22089_TR7360_c0_g1_i1:51-1382(+)